MQYFIRNKENSVKRPTKQPRGTKGGLGIPFPEGRITKGPSNLRRWSK